jgi:ribosomal protein S18 acetylase RimI-like enzyme
MQDMTLLPLSHAARAQLDALMDEEVGAWRCELDWDYTPVKEVLVNFMDQNLLPGYVACNHDMALGYTYFLTHRNKGVIGTLYASRQGNSQDIADQILSTAIESLIDQKQIARIEAQIFPFHRLQLHSVFAGYAFRDYPRAYLELELARYRPGPDHGRKASIEHWDQARLAQAAAIVKKSYEREIDSLICEDYCSLAGCEGYLRSLVANPGCGTFLPKASFMGYDDQRRPSGFVLTSRISPLGAMIPQISILPAHQGCGLGRALMDKALSYLKLSGFQKVSLTVTRDNLRALEWYQRLGFRVRKEFSAYIWQRS